MERYLDSWQYAIKKTAIENLMFEVSIYRASILDDQDKTLVCRRRFIPWGQKVFSPKELILLFNNVYSTSGAGSTREEQLQQLLEPFKGNTDEEKMKSYLDSVVHSQETEEIMRNLSTETQLLIPENLSATEKQKFLQDQQKINEQRQRLQNAFKQCYHIFTRPPTEDFLNKDELDSEVIPAEPMTDLAKYILGIHEGQEKNKSKNTKDSDDYANDPNLFKTAERPDVPTAAKERSFYIGLATGRTHQTIEGSAGIAAGLPGKFSWYGIENILIQLVNLGDGTLIARPALLDEHVISVDENFIISYRITLSSTRDGNAALVDSANAAKFLNRSSVLVDGAAEGGDDDDSGDDGNGGELRIVEAENSPGGSSAATPGGKNNGKRNGRAVEKSNLKKSEKGDKKNSTITEQERQRATSRDRRWLMVRSNVVKRGVVLALAKRAQSPSTLDARGGVNAAKMLRQALGLHDDLNINQQTSGGGGVQTGSQVFGGGKSSIIPTLAIGNNNNNNNHNNNGQGNDENSKKKQISFISCPPPGVRRVNFFVTVEAVNEIERESVFARCSWVFPPAGVALDTEGNRKGGVRELMQTTTQTAWASRMIDDQYNQVTRHVLNVPIELHVLMHQTTPGTPRLVIEIFSGGDGGGHQTLEGYALLTCSPVPGLHRERIDMWRPVMSGWETMKSIFIGGSTSLVDRETVAVPYGKLALESQTLTNAVKREFALASQQQQQQQDPNQINNMDNNNNNNNNNRLFMMNSLNPVNLTPEVERDLSEACSVASHSRAGLMTTSQGSVEISLMCCVQELR